MSTDLPTCRWCGGSGLVYRWVPVSTLGGGHVVQQVCLCSFPWGRRELEDQLLERGDLGRLRDAVVSPPDEADHA